MAISDSDRKAEETRCTGRGWCFCPTCKEIPEDERPIFTKAFLRRRDGIERRSLREAALAGVLLGGFLGLLVGVGIGVASLEPCEQCPSPAVLAAEAVIGGRE